MIIAYESNTGYTRQYAELLGEELGLPVFPVGKIPAYHRGEDAIFLGWLMGGFVTGLARARLQCNVRCVAATGMSPESAEIEEALHKKNGLAPGVPLFYLQAGYDFRKLKGVYKAIMSLKNKSILENYAGMTQEEKETHPTYRMVARGDSVVSKEHLERVIAWAKSR